VTIRSSDADAVTPCRPGAWRPRRPARWSPVQRSPGGQRKSERLDEAGKRLGSPRQASTAPGRGRGAWRCLL